MGRPTINIIFKKLAQTIIKRSSNGIAVLIIKDDTNKTFNTIAYSHVEDIEASKFTEKNRKYIEDVLKGGVRKVIVSRVDVAAATPIVTAVSNIGNQHYNWIGIAEGTTDNQAKLVLLVKALPKISAVVYQTAADHETIVNFTNPKVIVKGGTELTGDQYIPRMLGLLCGCPLTESTTYKVTDDLEAVIEPANVDDAVDAGELVLFNDEGVVRVARGVNSLQTLGASKYEDMKKITIMDTLTVIRCDVLTMFKEHYVGQYKNSYDNQIIFFVGVQEYLDQLSFEGVLDITSKNVVSVNIAKQRSELMKVNPEAAEWSDQKIKNNTVGSNVYPITNIKVNDAMEDLEFDILN